MWAHARNLVVGVFVGNGRCKSERPARIVQRGKGIERPCEVCIMVVDSRIEAPTYHKNQVQATLSFMAALSLVSVIVLLLPFVLALPSRRVQVPSPVVAYTYQSSPSPCNRTRKLDNAQRPSLARGAPEPPNPLPPSVG